LVGQRLYQETSSIVIVTAAGVAVAGLLLGGKRLWPAVGLAAMIGRLVGGSPLSFALYGGASNVLQAVVAVELLGRMNFDHRMERLRDAAALLAVGALSSLIAPSLGLLAALWTGWQVNPADFRMLWATWWLSGMVSILVIVPLVVSWPARGHIRLSKPEVLEGATLLVLTTCLAVIVFWAPRPVPGGPLGVYGLLLLMFWMGLRADVRIVSLAIATHMCIGIGATLFGPPPLQAADLGTRLVQTELFFAVTGTMYLCVAAVSGERRAAVRALSKQVDRLEDALTEIRSQDQSKSDFIAILSHEIRNPLTPVVTYLELLHADGLDSPDAARYVKVIADNVAAITRLLDDLLDIARISRDHFPLQRRYVAVDDVVRSSFAAIDPHVRAGDRTLTAELPDHALTVLGDPTRLEQVFVNLMTNAVKYTPSGGQVRLTSRLDGNFVVVTVSDDGIGIAPERLEDIFEPFTRAGNGTERAGGLGVGLYLSRQLVELHGGKLIARSPGLGRGSSFDVRLPLHTELAAPDDGAPREAAASEQDRPTETQLVLIVDDNREAADGIRLLVSSFGHQSLVAQDAYEAQALLDSFTPDAAILDIGLPGMSGYDLARTLRSRLGSAALLIAVTGYGQQADKVRALEAGFNHHMTKPVDGAAIRTLLAKRGEVPDSL
jgi:signal transduction histidine kinase/ActR/RegA family two-component response regulator